MEASPRRAKRIRSRRHGITGRVGGPGLGNTDPRRGEFIDSLDTHQGAFPALGAEHDRGLQRDRIDRRWHYRRNRRRRSRMRGRQPSGDCLDRRTGRQQAFGNYLQCHHFSPLVVTGTADAWH